MRMDVRRLLGAPRRAWTHVVGRQAEAYPVVAEAAQPGPRDELIAAYAETTKEVRSLFLVHVGVVAYALLTVLGTRDADFYGAGAGIKRPLVGVDVSPPVFFVVMHPRDEQPQQARRRHAVTTAQ